jgi:DNA-binding transcriptional regulator YiaG
MNSTIRAQRRTKAFKSPETSPSPKSAVGVPVTRKGSRKVTKLTFGKTFTPNPMPGKVRTPKAPWIETGEGSSLVSSPASGTSPQAPAREAKLATQLLTEVAAVSPDVDVLCETYGMRREELSRLTGFSLRALADWSSGKLPSQPAQRRLQEIRRFLDALSGLVQPTAIPTWMRSPNPAFGRLTPLQVIELGEIDRLWAMIHERG